MMKQNGMIFLTKDSFIFKIGNLHKDDLERVEDMYRNSYRIMGLYNCITFRIINQLTER